MSCEPHHLYVLHGVTNFKVLNIFYEPHHLYVLHGVTNFKGFKYLLYMLNILSTLCTRSNKK